MVSMDRETLFGWVAALPITMLLLVDTGGLAASDEYTDAIWPLISKYCLDCHFAEKRRGEIDRAHSRLHRSAEPKDGEPLSVARVEVRCRVRTFR